MHICLSLLSSQHLTSLPVLRTSPLMSIYRKQSPFSIARAGAQELRSTSRVHLLQTVHVELMTQESRIWESTYSAVGDSSGGKPCARGPVPSCQWQQCRPWCPAVGRGCSPVPTIIVFGVIWAEVPTAV